MNVSDEKIATEPDDAPPTTAYSWGVVVMLWFICFFNYADRQAIFSVFPLLKTELHFNKEQLGTIGAAFTLVYAIGAPFAGQVGDRWPRKLVIIAGLSIWSMITGFTSICSKVWQFQLVRGAEGLGETFYFPASMSMISDYHGPATRSRAMSLHQTSVYAGTIGGSALAGYLAMRHGWRTPFVALAFAGIALGLALARFVREPRRNEAERLLADAPTEQAEAIPFNRFLAELVRTPTALMLVLAFFGANSVALVFLSWMPTFLNEKFHLDLAHAGLGATFFIQVASMIGAMFGGVLADRWSRRAPGGRIATQALGAILGAPFIVACGLSRDIYWLMAAMTMFGLCKGLYDANIWASLYDVVPVARRGTAVGMMNMIGWLGGGLGTYLIGRVTNRGVGMSQAIAATAVVYVGVAAILLFASTLAARDVRRVAALEAR